MEQQQPVAEVILATWPTSMHTAQAAFVELTVRNRTDQVWNPDDPYAVYASYHWVTEQGEWLPHDGFRTNLPRTVAPGEQLRLAVRVHPPLIPGRYHLVLDLVRDNVGWLKLDKIVSIEVRQATERRATLVINGYTHDRMVSSSIRRKTRSLRLRGFASLILTNHIDERLPFTEQAYMVEATPELILAPDPNSAWVAEHFAQSSLYLFEYNDYYPLVELITAAPNGRTILDYHGPVPGEQGGNSEFANVFERGIDVTRLFALADYVIAHSEEMRQRLIDTEVIDSERVVVMHYGAPIDRLHPQEQMELPVELSDGSPILLSVLGPRRNDRVDLLVKMVARVRKAFPRTRLLLVGDEQDPLDRSIAEAISQLIADLGVEENVIFTGPKAHDRLPQYYDACDLYVTSGIDDGFSEPVIEAMAFRKPVVAAAEASLMSIVGDAGLLFEPENVEQFAEYVLALLTSKTSTRNSHSSAPAPGAAKSR